MSRPGAAAAWLKRSLLVLGLLAALAAAALWAKAEHIVLGAEGFMFGYPLVIMELTRAGAEASVGPPNHLKRVRAFPDAGFKEVVRPNVDTLYTSAFIDMAQGPFVFEMPAQSQRYELMPFMDGWTNVFAAPGTRTLGGQGGRFLLAGPGWAGTVPEGLSLLRAPTRMVWLIGRTQTHGAADYAVVHKLQDGIRLRTLAHWTAGIDPPAPAWQPAAERAPPPMRQMQAMTTTEFFDRLALLMVDNPPAPADAPMLAKLARIDVAPGQPPDWSPLERTAVGLGRWIAERRVRRELAQPRDLVNGWSTPPSLLGDYGTHYNIRAVVAMVGLGANLPADATYPNTRIDAAGQPLNGSHRYRLHFVARQLPPVRAFWSLTAYGADDFLIANPLNRHALGDRDPLVFNADGSLDLWVQAEPPPADQQANWLPVKHGEPFLLNARLYWPKPEALDGRWNMPALQRLD